MSYVGYVLRVIGVDENLILVEPISEKHSPRLILNLDRVEVRKVSDQFALKCAPSLEATGKRVVFEATGETRPPKKGEWCKDNNGDFRKCLMDIPTEHEIYHVVEGDE
jgi:hypothetical protein